MRRDVVAIDVVIKVEIKNNRLKKYAKLSTKITDISFVEKTVFRTFSAISSETGG